MQNRIGKCVIADDVRAPRQQIARWMEDLGFTCFTAADGVEAYELIAVNHPDLVISDIDMPDCTGFDLLRLIRNSEDAMICKTPVLVISSLQDHEVERFVREHRADSFLAKPLTKSTFLDAVFRTLRRSPAWGSFDVGDDSSPRISPTLRELVRRAGQNP
ncbi:response regulator [Roseiconus nitratireducens]|uniref:Response regulator n=1 Tax=Roseiconus nitratireducens TaxID=2605748 RepID=A0A5M6DD09_9BACT|nr:response regulator [Roseiconus nitratireducens]KAA5545451.1 response regulator [Roseiconus nitratireducens]